MDWHAAALRMSDEETIEWICEDNTIVDIMKDDILSLCGEILTRKTQATIAARIKKDEVLSLTTIEEIDSYEINF